MEALGILKEGFWAQRRGICELIVCFFSQLWSSDSSKGEPSDSEEEGEEEEDDDDEMVEAGDDEAEGALKKVRDPCASECDRHEPHKSHGVFCGL